MKLYKLTTQDNKTRKGESNECVWGPNVTHKAIGSLEQELCSDGFIHAYESPLVAVFLNSIHANIDNPKLWKCDGEIVKRDGQLKCGVRTLTTVKEIALPILSIEQRIAIAILCAKVVYKDKQWNIWADKWLNGTDRSVKTAADAADVAYAAAYAANAAAANAAYAAADAARAAANAARAAAVAADAAAAADAADTAANAAANVAANVAHINVGDGFDLLKIIKEVMKGN